MKKKVEFQKGDVQRVSRTTAWRAKKSGVFSPQYHRKEMQNFDKKDIQKIGAFLLLAHIFSNENKVSLAFEMCKHLEVGVSRDELVAKGFERSTILRFFRELECVGFIKDVIHEKYRGWAYLIDEKKWNKYKSCFEKIKSTLVDGVGIGEVYRILRTLHGNIDIVVYLCHLNGKGVTVNEISKKKHTYSQRVYAVLRDLVQTGTVIPSALMGAGIHGITYSMNRETIEEIVNLEKTFKFNSEVKL